MIPNNITKNHILLAIDEIERKGMPKENLSKKYGLFYKDKEYAPKYVISLANYFANGKNLNLSQFSGGIESNRFLENIGFDIICLVPEKPNQACTPLNRLLPDEKFIEEKQSQMVSSDYEVDESVLNELIRFEFLLNNGKLQYLIDCFEKNIDEAVIGKFIKSMDPDKIKEGKILHSHFGRIFAVYLNNPIYQGGPVGKISLGPLLKNYEPKQNSVFSDIYAKNRVLKQYIDQPDDWFAYFCEYVTIKISIHELLVDAPDHLHDWGYEDVRELRQCSEKTEKIYKSDLRKSVVHMMHLGINPFCQNIGQKQDISHLKDLDYPSFMKQRNSWVNCANFAANEIMRKKCNERIPLQWDSYSLCAFDSGPVFIRKRRELIFPRICGALSSYDKWDSPIAIHEKMQKILEPEIDILIGRYWDYFGPNNDTVEYFQTHSDMAIGLNEIKRSLNEKYTALEKSNNIKEILLCQK